MIFDSPTLKYAVISSVSSFSFSGELPLDTGNIENYVEIIRELNLTNYVTYDVTDEELKSYGMDDPIRCNLFFWICLCILLGLIIKEEPADKEEISLTLQIDNENQPEAEIELGSFRLRFLFLIRIARDMKHNRLFFFFLAFFILPPVSQGYSQLRIVHAISDIELGDMIQHDEIPEFGSVTEIQFAGSENYKAVYKEDNKVTWKANVSDPYSQESSVTSSLLSSKMISSLFLIFSLRSSYLLPVFAHGRTGGSCYPQ